MNKFSLRIKLESDTTFGRGDGVAGLIDTEVEHDANGLPFLRGRTLRGLLSEECANILFSIDEFPDANDWKQAAKNLFGRAGSTLDDDGKLHIGNAVLPEDLRDAVSFEVNEYKKAKKENKKAGVSPNEIIESLTAIRRQTRMSENGSPEEGSLRSSRVILRETEFVADLIFAEEPQDESKELHLLSASAAGLQRIGLGRNRGRGKVSVRLMKNGGNLPVDFLEKFANALGGEK